MSGVRKSKWDTPGVARHIEALWVESSSDISRKEVADWIGPLTGKFLDLGCGTARIAPFLKTRKYTGVDESEEMLKIAKTRVPSEHLRLADVTRGKLPFADASFNAALCMEVIRHLISYEPVLRELARLIKRRVYIVDAFGGEESGFGEERVLDQTFPSNRWSLPQFLADVDKHFPGWKVKVHTLRSGQLAILIEAQ